MEGAFRYARRVQFGETDMAGIVHFAWMFRYMEEAEHAAWRAAGLSIAGTTSDLGWPRVAASFDFRSPLRFEDEFEVSVRLVEVGTRSLQYVHTISRGDVLVGTGRMKTSTLREIIVMDAMAGMDLREIEAEIAEYESEHVQVYSAS